MKQNRITVLTVAIVAITLAFGLTVPSFAETVRAERANDDAGGTFAKAEFVPESEDGDIDLTQVPQMFHYRFHKPGELQCGLCYFSEASYPDADIQYWLGRVNRRGARLVHVSDITPERTNPVRTPRWVSPENPNMANGCADSAGITRPGEYRAKGRFLFKGAWFKTEDDFVAEAFDFYYADICSPDGDTIEIRVPLAVLSEVKVPRTGIISWIDRLPAKSVRFEETDYGWIDAFVRLSENDYEELSGVKAETKISLGKYAISRTLRYPEADYIPFCGDKGETEEDIFKG